MALGMNTPSMRPAPRSTPQRRARGSIIINTAIALSLIVITLVGAELGYLFYMKREFQKTADLAALAGAQKLASSGATGGCDLAIAAAISNAGQNLPGLSINTPECGNWAPSNSVNSSTGCFVGTNDHFIPGATPFNAIRVRIAKAPPTLFSFFSGNRTICVQASAAEQQPLASLTIRSTLVVVDSEQSLLLDAIFGSMLGGALTVNGGGWQGLLDTNIQLLGFLDQLKLDLGLSALTYDQVLGTEFDAGELLLAMIHVMERNGNTASIAVGALNDVLIGVNAAPFKLRISDFLAIATGTDTAGLQTELQLFQLVQGMIQIANGKNSLAADIPINIPNIASVTAKVRITEPPQVSAVGNPSLINPALGLDDPNRIYVRTAQIRALFSINLSGLSGVISQITAAAGTALAPIVDFLGSVLSLNLQNLVASLGTLLSGLLGCGLITSCPVMKVVYTEALSTPIDVSISAGNGSALVSGFTCTSNDTKSLTANASTSIARLNIGTVAGAFYSNSPVTAKPVSILEIGYREAKYDSCGLLTSSCKGAKWKTSSGSFVEDSAAAMKTVVAGLGLSINSNIGGSSTDTSLFYSAPVAENLPEIDAAPFDGIAPDPSFKALSAQSLIQSLAPTLEGIQIYAYSSGNSGLLNSLLEGTLNLINGLLDTLKIILKDALRPLLDPLANTLLDMLGINLAQAEVGARLSCNRGAELVY